jgi:hypothetical protein
VANIDWNIPEHAHKIFHIKGWCSDGKPLVRYGILWLKFDKQPMALVKAICALPINEDKFLPFKTLAGEIGYHVERVK